MKKYVMGGMPPPKNNTHYINGYNARHYDRVQILFPKGKKEVYKREANNRGFTLSGWVISLMEEAIKKP